MCSFFFCEMRGFFINVNGSSGFQCATKCSQHCRFKASTLSPCFQSDLPPPPFTSPRYHGWILWPAGPIFGPTQRKWTHSSLRHLIMPLCDWWSSWWTLSVRPCCPAPALMCFHPALSNKQHKSHVEDPSHSRPISDRKRKFVDSELALDTEGNGEAEIGDIVTSSLVYFHSISCRWLFPFCVSELFQDLSQLQEIWIAEGQSQPSVCTTKWFKLDHSGLVPLLISIYQCNFSTLFVFWFLSRYILKD